MVEHVHGKDGVSSSNLDGGSIFYFLKLRYTTPESTTTMRAALTNKSINYLNVHFSFQRFAETIASTFGPIFLYQIGFSVSEIFLVWTASYLMRFILRPFYLQVLLKIGLKKSIVLGSILYCGLFPILSQVEGIGLWLLAFVIYYAILDIVYWLPYHVYFALAGDSEKRGKQAGMRAIFVSILGIFAPIVGGASLHFQGFGATTLIGVLFFALAILPLRYINDIKIPPMVSPRDALKSISKRGLAAYACYGFFHKSYRTVWVLVLFFMFDNAFSTGVILSIAVILNVIISYIVGHSIDLQKNKKHYLLGGLLFAACVIGKVFFGYTAAVIILLDAIFLIGGSLYGPHEDVAVYNGSKQSGQALWFQFFAETGWDIGTGIAAILVAWYAFYFPDLRYVMLISLLAIPCMLFVVSPSYKKYFEKG